MPIKFFKKSLRGDISDLTWYLSESHSEALHWANVTPKKSQEILTLSYPSPASALPRAVQSRVEPSQYTSFSLTNITTLISLLLVGELAPGVTQIRSVLTYRSATTHNLGEDSTIRTYTTRVWNPLIWPINITSPLSGTNRRTCTSHTRIFNRLLYYLSYVGEFLSELLSPWRSIWSLPLGNNHKTFVWLVYHAFYNYLHLAEYFS